MADASPTAASVVAGSDALTDSGSKFGATITAGKVLYKDTTQSPARWELAQCDGSLLESGSAGLGIALNGGGDGQPGDVQVGGEITPGFTAVEGTIYVVSNTAGNMMPLADLVTATWYCSIVGVGTGTGTIKMRPYASGEQIPA
jgi:hypothetical protein